MFVFPSLSFKQIFIVYISKFATKYESCDRVESLQQHTDSSIFVCGTMLAILHASFNTRDQFYLLTSYPAQSTNTDYGNMFYDLKLNGPTGTIRNAFTKAYTELWSFCVWKVFINTLSSDHVSGIPKQCSWSMSIISWIDDSVEKMQKPMVSVRN